MQKFAGALQQDPGDPLYSWVRGRGILGLWGTAGINRSNTAARAVLEQPCSTGGRTDTVRPKREPTGRTDLSDRSRLVLGNRSQELIGQACPTRRQVLRSDSACPTTGRTRLFEHRSNCRVRPVNAGSGGSGVDCSFQS
ncbi:hypothetical protein PCASD_05913 [Puccinia coronata f. sp. avenae]|uniref:Uncharacterized protein n=1 Tax=Puccinia coronata f. sp. avenae TaxID=200324 RepID=A0A2N5V6C7_9BASI|nr:hypothetical protein PCASD_05913 [Puccinia coronata f. sp. avenae]